MTWFVVTRRFDAGPSFAKTEHWPPRMDKHALAQKLIEAIALSDYGAECSLDWLIELYDCGGLHASILYREPDPPALEKPKELRDRSWAKQRIGLKTCPEALVAHHLGDGLTVLAC
jgi:hypothetical protein